MKTIQNPILRGFCPDPCMIRTGDDYYIATSTFEWWPCVNLYHSKDLAHWEQLPSPLREPGQMDLRGDPNSGGIWAPDLSWDGQYYYLLVTNVTTKKGRWYNTHNYMSRAASITGPWSQPVYLNSIGFDPSLLHDTDGKCYLVNMVNGFKGVLVQQMDPETGALLGERRKVYSGSGIGCTEGPRIYHFGDYYYLIVAEGGNLTQCSAISRMFGRKRCLAHLHGQTTCTPVMDDIYGGVLALSNFIRENYLQSSTLDPQRAYILHNCIDTARFCPGPASKTLRAQLGFTDKDFVVLYCGRLDPDKGIHKLMEAIAALHEPHIKLLIVGSPFFARTQQSAFQRKLEQQAKSLGNRVQFTG